MESRDWDHTKIYTNVKKKKWWQFWKKENNNEGIIGLGAE